MHPIESAIRDVLREIMAEGGRTKPVEFRQRVVAKLATFPPSKRFDPGTITFEDLQSSMARLAPYGDGLPWWLKTSDRALRHTGDAFVNAVHRAVARKAPQRPIYQAVRDTVEILGEGG